MVMAIDKKRKPLVTEKVFAKEYVASRGNGTKAAMKATGNKNPKSAAVTASRMLKRDNVQKAINDALEKRGATPEFAVNVLAEVAEQDKEIGARRLAAKDILELHGWRKDERPQATLQINNAFFSDVVSNKQDVIDV